MKGVAYLVISVTCSVWAIGGVYSEQSRINGLLLHVHVLFYVYTHVSTLSDKEIN